MPCAHLRLARPLLNSTRSSATAPRHATSIWFTHSTRTMATFPAIDLPIRLVLDFDGTLTRKDTMHLVAQAGYSHQVASGRVPQPPPWSEIVAAYMTDFRAHTEIYKPQSVDRTSPGQEFAWLDSLEQIEESSFQRTLAAGIFDHLTTDEMERAGKSALHNGELYLRSGWHELASRIQGHNATYPQPQLPIRILSVNWSATFIRGVLQQAFEEHQSRKPLIHAHHIYANELPSIIEEDIAPSSGGYSSPPSGNTPIRTSGSKAALMQKFRQTTSDKDNSLLMYVGDSVTDLDCLLTADFGFIIRDDPITSGQKELAETCRRIGISTRPIAEALGRSDKDKTLWWIQDFSEIVHWLNKATNA